MNQSVKRTLALGIFAAFCAVPSLAGPGDSGTPSICLETPFFDGPPLIRSCTRPPVPPLRAPTEGALKITCPRSPFLYARFSLRPCPRPVGLINMSPVGFAPSSIRVPRG